MNTTNNNPTVKMSKGFTMIELIFVIVIIGILAAVAIPRLAATRDDAKVAQCAADVTTLMKDLSSYYTSQGAFSTDLKNMTNVEATGTGIKADGSAGSITYACDEPKNPAVNFAFSTYTDANKNVGVAMKANATDVDRGTVDGDLGYLLAQKNIVGATDGTNRDHNISGIRVKR